MLEPTPVLEPGVALAMAVAFGHFEGMDFDWDAMSWRRRD